MIDTDAAERLTSSDALVLDAIDEQALVDDLVHLVRVPSVTGTDAETDLQHWHSRRLADLGFEVDTWRLDLAGLREDAEFPGTEAPRTEGYGVVGVLGPAGVPALALQGHVDVVPPGDPATWDGCDPWSGAIRDGAVHGRGACDMKAGLAANLAVARALAVSGLRLERPFAVHAVVSEEDGGLGAFATLRRGHRAEAAVITEPTGGDVVVANAGALTFRLTVTGLATHGSTRHAGRSAFEAFLPVHVALLQLERERNQRPDPLFDGNPLPYPISIGIVRAGEWASSVPDVLVAEGRLGVRLDEDPQVARDALEHAVRDACRADPWLRDHPVEIGWPGGQFASGRLDVTHPLVGEVRAAVRTTGGRPGPPSAVPYGSDLRLYSGLGGIPTLHYGPGDVRLAHGPREQVDIAELVATTRALAVLAARRCGAHGTRRSTAAPS